mmetsp:Transcript_64506/g.178881  ORF Transcript_64506/g.178881 Transcript_64506/m.178881 type:complete len:120 (-) Transcript_64506:1396-1755(-)
MRKRTRFLINVLLAFAPALTVHTPLITHACTPAHLAVSFVALVALASRHTTAESRFVVENYHAYDMKPDTTSVKTADKDDEEFRVYDEETSPRVREVRDITPHTPTRYLCPCPDADPYS